MKFVFEAPIQIAQFDVTEQAWKQQVAENPGNSSDTYYNAALNYCRGVVDHSKTNGDGDVCVCSVVQEEQAHASALMVVSHAFAKTMNPHLKMLSLYVQPSLNLADREPNAPVLALIAACCIIGALELTYDTYPAEVLKIHTAFPLDAAFMTAVTTAILAGSELLKGVTVVSQGAWIVVTKPRPPSS